MRNSEKMKLISDTFTTSTLYTLYEDQQFVDVTLACADDQQIKAHKVVLSNGSSFFHNILLKNPHPSPLIYLRGVKQENLQAIVQFLYLGQAEVPKENLTVFLNIAADLGIKELMEETKECSDTQLKKEPPMEMFEFGFDDASHNSKNNEGSDDKILVGCMPNVSQMLFDGIYHCDNCDYKTGHKKHIQTHKLSIHEKVRYECDECIKKFTDPSSLRRHKKSKHEGVRFACDQCSQSSTTTFHLQTHKRIKHAAAE